MKEAKVPKKMIKVSPQIKDIKKKLEFDNVMDLDKTSNVVFFSHLKDYYI